MRRMNFWGLMAAGLLSVGCAADATTTDVPATTGCAELRYPEVSDSAIHVAVTCAIEAPDGSAASPYSTMTAALAAAPAGATFVIAPGTYAETLEISRDVRIVGLVDGSKGIILQAPREGDAANILKRPAPESADIILQVPSPDALGIILKSPAPETAAIRVVSGAALTLVGVHISDAARAGIEVDAGSLVLESSLYFKYPPHRRSPSPTSTAVPAPRGNAARSHSAAAISRIHRPCSAPPRSFGTCSSIELPGWPARTLNQPS